MVKVLLLVLCLGIGGCTALQTAMSLAAPASKGIEAELVVGDKQEEVNTEVGSQVTNSKQTAQTIENHIESVPLSFMLLMVLGWLLPSPNEIFRGLKNMVLFWKKT